VKLLLDENVSDRIVTQIAELFPGSAHVKTIGLDKADDRVICADKWDEMAIYGARKRTFARDDEAEA